MWIDVNTDIAIPVNILPLIDDTDFKSREIAITYNQAGMDLVWNFVTTAGVQTQTAITPTTGGGDYDWTHVGDGMYKIGIPASGGASVNNATAGHGWFTGICTGVLAWTSPIFGFRVAATNNDLIDSTAGLIDAIWDEVLTAATHNVPSSAGRRMRQLTSDILREETAQGPGTGNNQIQLDTGASATDDLYKHTSIAIVGGTGLGQTRAIITYNGTTKTATVNEDWSVLPDATSEFIITGIAIVAHSDQGLAQAGNSSSITLSSSAAAVDNQYLGQVVVIVSGAGAGQARVITGYTGSTKVATINGRSWTTNPDGTSGYIIFPADQWYGIQIKAVTDNLPDSGALTTITASLARLLGLSYENTYQHTRTYSGTLLQSAKVDLYDSKTNAQAHDGTIGIVAKYTLTFTYNGNNLATMQVVRDS